MGNNEAVTARPVPKGIDLEALKIRIEDKKGRVGYTMPANARIAWMRLDHPDWCLTSAVEETNETGALVKCQLVTAEGTLLATGHAGRATPEKAETAARSRCLIAAGYVAPYEYQHEDDAEPGQEETGYRAPRRSGGYDDGGPPATGGKCEGCGAGVTAGQRSYSERNFDGKVFCMDCQREKRGE